MKKISFLTLILMLVLGCESNRPVENAKISNLEKEGMVTFARPAEYSIWFGSYSQRELFDIVYQRFSRNSAGQAVVHVGIRYRGPSSWTNWFTTAQKHITISGRCSFYGAPGGQVSGGPVIYTTNNRAITIRLGETYDFKAVCPLKEAQSYHVILGKD